MVVTKLSYFFVVVFVLLVGKSSEALNSEKVQLAFDLLKEEGITGLCHPTVDEKGVLLEGGSHPLFPPCSAPSALPPPHSASSIHHGHMDQSRNLEFEFDHDKMYYIRNGLLAFTCVCVAALAAGLTMGLMSLDPLNLLIKMRAALTEEEKQQAASLLPIVKQHHLLLVTLLLLNSMANEALPLFLDEIVPSYIAVILSVTLVLFFGEIIPSAIFTGPDKIKIAAGLTPIVRAVMCLLYPLAFPIAKLLDVVLHDDNDEVSSSFNRGELSALVRIQYEERMAFKKRNRKERLEAGASSRRDLMQKLNSMHELAPSLKAIKREMSNEPGLNDSIVLSRSSDSTRAARPALLRATSIVVDEVNMVEGALKMKTRMAMDVYTPLRKVVSVPYDLVLNEKEVINIYSCGYSRIPVYQRRPGKPKDKSAICGVLMTKQLIVINTQDKRPVSTLPLYNPFCVSPTLNLVELLNMFQTGGSVDKGGHLALVCARPAWAEEALDRGEPVPEKAGLMGVLTLEDCLEALIQEQIYDERDHLELNEVRVAKWAFRKWKLYVQKKKIKREEELLEREHNPGLLNVVMESRGPNEETSLLDNGDSGDSRFSLFSFFQSFNRSGGSTGDDDGEEEEGDATNQALPAIV